MDVIVDPDGIIQAMGLQRKDRTRCKRFVRKVRAAQYVRAHPDELPAKWKEGKKL